MLHHSQHLTPERARHQPSETTTIRTNAEERTRDHERRISRMIETVDQWFLNLVVFNGRCLFSQERERRQKSSGDLRTCLPTSHSLDEDRPLSSVKKPESQFRAKESYASSKGIGILLVTSLILPSQHSGTSIAECRPGDGVSCTA
jgi:hypothetical protein